MGKPVEGAEADRKASDIMQKLVDDHPAITLFQAWLANFQINIGRALDRQKRLAEAFTAQSVAAFADAVKTGWALPSELKEPDFDALRGRADFQRLVADVEAKVEKK